MAIGPPRMVGWNLGRHGNEIYAFPYENLQPFTAEVLDFERLFRKPTTYSVRGRSSSPRKRSSSRHRSRGDGDDLVEEGQLRILLDHGEKPVLLEQVDLVEDDEELRLLLRLLLVAQHLDDELIALAEWLGGVDDEDGDVGLGEARPDVVHHPHVELVQRTVNAGRVEKGDLSPLPVVEDADDTVAG